jgi:hypothetical protein
MGVCGNPFVQGGLYIRQGSLLDTIVGGRTGDGSRAITAGGAAAVADSIATAAGAPAMVLKTQAQLNAMSTAQRTAYDAQYNSLTSEQQAASQVAYAVTFQGGMASNYIQVVGNVTIVTVPPCGNGYAGYDGRFVVVPPFVVDPDDPDSDPSCSSLPDFRTVDAYFLDPDGNRVDADNLALGMTVTPVVRFMNASCVATNASSAIYNTDSLYGTNGGFSVRAQTKPIAGSYGSPEFVYNISPLQSYEGATLLTPRVTMNTLGAHKIQFFIDPPNTCSGVEGCIKEVGLHTGNTYELDYTVKTPSIDVGSFYKGRKKTGGWFGCRGGRWSETSPFATSYASERNIAPPYITECQSGTDWGIIWNPIGMESCVGTHKNQLGVAILDFNAVPDPGIGRFPYDRYASRLGNGNIDLSITEPTPGTYGDFKVMCTGYDGLSYEDTHRLYFGPTNLPPTVTLSSALNSSGAYTTGDRTGSNKIQNTDTVQLQWVSTNADACVVDVVESGTVVSSVAVNRSGVSVAGPAVGSTDTYRAVCTNLSTSVRVTDTLKIQRDGEVIQAPALQFEARVNGDAWSDTDRTGSRAVLPADVLKLRWATAHVTSCRALGGSGFITLNAKQNLDSTVTGPHTTLPQNYRIECTGEDTTKITADILVDTLGPDLRVDKNLIRRGDTVVVSWITNGASGCLLSSNITSNTTYDSQTPNADGSISDNPTSTITYTYTCGLQSDSETVRVLPVFQET